MLQSKKSIKPTTSPLAATGTSRSTDFPMTIRLRLTLWYTALLGSTLILFSFIFYSTLAANLWMQTQQEAARQASEVANALALQLQGNILIIRSNPTRVQFPDLDFFGSSLGVQIIDLNGMILKRSENLGPMSVRNYAMALPTIRNGKTHRFYSTSENGTPLLVYTVPIIANKIIVGAVQVIIPVAGVENTLNQVSRYLIIGTAFSLILAAIVGAFLARSALSPIDTITQTASAISRTKDLSRRLNINNDSSEIGQLAATFNQMLDRIQQLFKTQERLIADVSHELRTPLTTVQGNLDLLRRYTATAWKPHGNHSRLLCHGCVQRVHGQHGRRHPHDSRRVRHCPRQHLRRQARHGRGGRQRGHLYRRVAQRGGRGQRAGRQQVRRRVLW